MLTICFKHFLDLLQVKNKEETETAVNVGNLGWAMTDPQ